MPSEKSTAPISLPQAALKSKANKKAVPPMPIIKPEQKDIKQKEINCAFVNFSRGFININRPIVYSKGLFADHILLYRIQIKKSSQNRIFFHFLKFIKSGEAYRQVLSQKNHKQVEVKHLKNAFSCAIINARMKEVLCK